MDIVRDIVTLVIDTTNTGFEYDENTSLTHVCISFVLFLVTCTRLYTPLCRSVGQLVGPSVGRLVDPYFTFFANFIFILSF